MTIYTIEPRIDTEKELSCENCILRVAIIPAPKSCAGNFVARLTIDKACPLKKVDTEITYNDNTARFEGFSLSNDILRVEFHELKKAHSLLKTR